jgi:hypothetical protein
MAPYMFRWLGAGVADRTAWTSGDVISARALLPCMFVNIRSQVPLARTVEAVGTRCERLDFVASIHARNFGTASATINIAAIRLRSSSAAFTRARTARSKSTPSREASRCLRALARLVGAE